MHKPQVSEKSRDESMGIQGADAAPYELLGLDEDRILAMAFYARQVAEEGELDTAEGLFKVLSWADPRSAYLHSCLGTISMRRGDREQAYESLRRSLELDPDNIATNTNLGELCLEDGRFEEAVECLERSISGDPDGRDAFANRARGLVMALGRLTEEERRGNGARAPGALLERITESEEITESQEIGSV